MARPKCRTLAVLACLSIFAAVPNALAQQFNPGALSLRLSPNMTEQQVEGALGYRPNSSQLMTCGSQTPAPWECLIWIFGSTMQNLRVTFQNVNGTWLVNSWYVFDPLH